jgi:hypothetical protein
MAGRFLVRRDYRDGTFLYLKRNVARRSFFGKSAGWNGVRDPQDATRFWTRDAAERVAFLLAVQDLGLDYSYTVREWDGSLWKKP